jgi:isoleucyl-tRNA synthetase
MLRHILLVLAKLTAPFVPFLAEDLHKKLKGEGLSVHLADWPKINKRLINTDLEKEMDDIRIIVTAGLAARKEKQIKVRQPLRSASLARKIKFGADLETLIMDELNVKNIIYGAGGEAPVTLETDLDQALIYEGYARELIRQIQDMRKEAKYKMDQKIFGRWHSEDKEVSAAINEWTKEIAEEALFEEFLGGNNKAVYDIEKEFEISPQKKIWLGIKK